MTPEEAIRVLEGAGDVGYEALDAIFRAFGFSSRTPSFEVELYYHPEYTSCGMFRAVDDRHHVLTPQQRTIARGIIRCVQYHQWARGRATD